MLVEFSVKNFMSFKDKVTFSMEAATGTENEENIISIPNINERILKSTAIYGANASGKNKFNKSIYSCDINDKKIKIIDKWEKN